MSKEWTIGEINRVLKFFLRTMAALDGCAVQCEREGDWGRNMYRNRFWDRFKGRTSQSLVTVPESLQQLTRPSFPLVSKVPHV